MIVKWNVETVGEVTMNVPDERLMGFLHALSLLGFDSVVEMGV